MWSLLLIIAMGGHDHRVTLTDFTSIEACSTEVNNLKATKSFNTHNTDIRLACEEIRTFSSYFSKKNINTGSGIEMLPRNSCAPKKNEIFCKVFDKDHHLIGSCVEGIYCTRYLSSSPGWPDEWTIETYHGDKSDEVK